MTKYSQVTIKRLFALSNNVCYFPKCQTKMINNDNSIVGEICHIQGENDGSARFNPNISIKERNSFDNLILMCPTHHTMIDANTHEYTVGVLNSIKGRYENNNKNKAYNIPEDVLKIISVAINYDEYSIERLYNFMILYKRLKGKHSKQLGYDHLRYIINGLKISSSLSEDEIDALKTIFNRLKNFSLNNKDSNLRINDKYLELLVLFLDKLPLNIKKSYIEDLKSKIEILIKKCYNDLNLPSLYKYLDKPSTETVNYLVENANSFNPKVFQRFIDDIEFQEIAKDKKNFINLEYIIWKELDKYDQENINDNNGYNNLRSLIDKFFKVNI